VVEPHAGDSRERLKDGPLLSASFNQPSGLAVLNGKLYVADAEISGVREVDMDPEGSVRTLVGVGLFDFGDVDGVGDAVRLQHVLAVCADDNKILVADAYNHKIKMLDPATRRVTTLLGDGKQGSRDGVQPRFNEPSGLAVAGRTLFVADQNNHVIRRVDLDTMQVDTLDVRFPPEPVRGSASVEEAVSSVYEAISGPAGPRDWDRLRSLFHPAAKMVTSRRDKEGNTRFVVMTLDEYIKNAGAYFDKNGFFESEVSRKAETFGDMAHVFSTYESRHSRADKKPFARGINSIQLLREDDRWFVLQVLWQSEAGERSIPPKYRKKQ